MTIKPSEEDMKLAEKCFYGHTFGAAGKGGQFDLEAIAKAIATARLQERERCAVICDNIAAAYGFGYYGITELLSEKIRDQT